MKAGLVIRSCAFKFRWIEASDTKQISLSVKVTASSRGDSSVSFSASLTTLRRTSSGMRFQTCLGLGDRSCNPASPSYRYRSYGTYDQGWVRPYALRHHRIAICPLSGKDAGRELRSNVTRGGYDPFGSEDPPFLQLNQKPLCGALVSPRFQNFLNNNAVFVDRTPRASISCSTSLKLNRAESQTT